MLAAVAVVVLAVVMGSSQNRRDQPPGFLAVRGNSTVFAVQNVGLVAAVREVPHPGTEQTVHGGSRSGLARRQAHLRLRDLA